MTKDEYEKLQDKFRNKLNNTPYPIGGKKSQDYKDGVRACMSILSDMYKSQEAV